MGLGDKLRSILRSSRERAGERALTDPDHHAAEAAKLKRAETRMRDQQSAPPRL